MHLNINMIILLSGLLTVFPQHSSSDRNELTASDKNRLLKIINIYRTKGCNCGRKAMPPVAPVVWDFQLEEAAVQHTVDMSENQFLSHKGSDGSLFNERISRAGFSWTSCAENVAEGYETTEDVVTGWIMSTEHCKNIMNSRYQYMGIARSANYWTQEFGAK